MTFETKELMIGEKAPFIKSNAKKLAVFGAMVKFNVALLGSVEASDGTFLLRILISKDDIERFEEEAGVTTSPVSVATYEA